MLENYIDQIEVAIEVIKANFPMVISWVFLLYGIHLFNFILSYRLNILGIHSRKVIGLPGVFLAPFLHASFNHVFFNSFPLLILMLFVSLNGKLLFYKISLSLIVTSGLLIWLLGRKAIHVGASALIMGYWGFLFMQTYQHPNIISVMLVIVLIYYFGVSFIASLLPGKKGVSWEGHFLGFLAGLTCYHFMLYRF